MPHPRVPIVDGRQQCIECHEWKPLDTDHWHRVASRTSGFMARCKPCAAARQHEKRATGRPVGRPRIPVIERLMTRVQTGPGCWTWLGRLDREGYGRTSWSKADGSKTDIPAHRAVFIALRGAIPDGLELDHLCRNRACVNPAHMEPVTTAENLRRSHAASPRTGPRRRLAS